MSNTSITCPARRNYALHMLQTREDLGTEKDPAAKSQAMLTLSMDVSFEMTERWSFPQKRYSRFMVRSSLVCETQRDWYNLTAFHVRTQLFKHISMRTS